MNHHEPVAPFIVSALAAIAVAENIWVFTAFVVVGAMAGVYYASLAKVPPDDDRTKKAKWVVGMISGVGLPSLAEFFYPPIKIALGHPLIVLVISFTLATLGSILIHKVFVKLDGRIGDRIGDLAAKGIEKAIESKIPGGGGE
jgi:hypothetical protein